MRSEDENEMRLEFGFSISLNWLVVRNTKKKNDSLTEIIFCECADGSNFTIGQPISFFNFPNGKVLLTFRSIGSFFTSGKAFSFSTFTFALAFSAARNLSNDRRLRVLSCRRIPVTAASLMGLFERVERVVTVDVVVYWTFCVWAVLTIRLRNSFGPPAEPAAVPLDVAVAALRNELLLVSVDVGRVGIAPPQCELTRGLTLVRSMTGCEMDPFSVLALQ